MSAGNVDTNGDVMDVLVERIRLAIDPDGPDEERAATAARLLADVTRRRAATAALRTERACAWTPGAAR